MKYKPEDHPRMIGIRTKIARAHAHGQELDGRIRSFINSHPARISYLQRPNLHEHGWILKSEPPVVPSDLSALIGDMLYNFRSALDHMIWQLVLANGEKPSIQNQFPIFDSPSEYKRAKNRRLQGVRKDAISVIDRYQPINEDKIALAHLNSLGNIDKHRELPVIYVHLEQINMRETIKLAPQETMEITMHTGTLSRGTEFLKVKVNQEEIDFEPTFGIAFGPDTPVEQKNVMDVFRSIWKTVTDLGEEMLPMITR